MQFSFVFQYHSGGLFVMRLISSNEGDRPADEFMKYKKEKNYLVR